MAEWLSDLREALAKGPAALVTILATEGSAPREAGARMVVTTEQVTGSIGGGNLEFQAIEQARAALGETPGTWRVQDYPLGPLLNQCCGGKVRLLVEHVDLAHAPWLQEAPGTRQLIANLTESRVERRWQSGPAAAPLTARGERPKAGACFKEPQEAALLPVLMFGAGHVGQAIIAASHGLPLAFDWQDNRAELTGFEALKLREAEAMIEAARQCPADTALLILTHDHALDYRLLAAALESKARFIGMIGSETKRARFISRLEKEGIGAADIARLICPIGHRHVQGKQPAVIAIAVLAQLLGLR